MADLAYKVGRGKAIICEKCITTNKNLFSCSLELLILARVEIQKGVLEQKLLKLDLINGIKLHFIASFLEKVRN